MRKEILAGVEWLVSYECYRRSIGPEMLMHFEYSVNKYQVFFNDHLLGQVTDRLDAAHMALNGTEKILEIAKRKVRG